MKSRKKSVSCKKKGLREAWEETRDRQREYAYVTDEELTRNFLTEEWERMKRKEENDPMVKSVLKYAREEGMNVPEELSRSPLPNPLEIACPTKTSGSLDLYTGCKRSPIEEATHLFEVTNMHKEQWYSHLNEKEVKEYGEAMFGAEPDKKKANEIIDDNLFHHREDDVKVLDEALEVMRTACPYYELP